MAVGKRNVLRAGGYVLAWLLLAVPSALAIFLSSSTTVTVASHDATVSPSLGQYVTIRTGPFLPDVRRDSGGPIGVDIVLGKTEADSTEMLVERYAFIASQPQSQVAIVERAVTRLVWDAAARGAVLAVFPLLLWALIGRQRRTEIFGRTPKHLIVATLATGTTIAAVVVLVIKPWQTDETKVVDQSQWQSLQSYLPEFDVPAEARDIEVQGTLAASGTKRLVLSAVDTYRMSREFYDAARDKAETLELRRPGEDESVAVIVSDRHDNIGMDQVARAIADRADASAVLNAGDDTSTGSEWEAFSLDSLDDAFKDYDGRFSVQGNHDHGTFVQGYLDDLGWQTASGSLLEGPGGGRLLAYNDPRSSGLGTWRDQPGISIDELAVNIADRACEAGQRINTLLVHDIDMGTVALERGCVDLVISGHVHVQVGPDLVKGSNGESGYNYTNGTTGGAAYAVAVGSKLRRPAEVTLVTYRDGRPVGLQPVTLQTNGVFDVGDYLPLTYRSEDTRQVGADGSGGSGGGQDRALR
ncbi:metallophosphoesterase [Nocardioides sp. Soil796]|uniref:metallophosphoesterase n=1 Tax=Nocardioides sp. Soil796 TaxID=1736412 RepID=UPI000AC163BA|nr:metallophosphoesterase [Nocardioides sp. Soil796]